MENFEKIKNAPKSSEPATKTPAPESERKERIVLTLDAIKAIISSQIGNKAKINRLEIAEASGGAKLSAELDAGFLGGKISIEGLIVNVGNEIAVHDLNIDARGYVKSQIENNLSGFTPAIKKYFEKQYRKPVFGMQIVGSTLAVDFESLPQLPPSSESGPKSDLEKPP